MIQLTITYGSTTIDLQANGYAVLDGYFPESDEGSGEPVTDSVDVWVSGSTAELETSLRAINTAFQYASKHQNGPEGCWLNYAINGTEATWRSRILRGSAGHDGKLDARARQGKMKIGLAIERLPYWEGAETAIPLTNGNGTNVTTGLNVLNCADGLGSSPNIHNNYADIAAVDIIGDQPAPLKLVATSLTPTYELGYLWVGHNHTDPANALWNLEAEAATGETGEPDELASGGNKVTKTMSSDIETDLFTWSLSAAMLSAAKGQFVHAMARFSHANNVPRIRWRLKMMSDLVLIWQSDPVLPFNQLAMRDFFTFRLPPWLQGLDGLSAINLVLTGQRTDAASFSFTLDYLQLVPADSFRLLAMPGVGIAQNSRLVDDPISGDLYRDDGSGTGRLGIVSAYGDPIMLEPGKLQRLYFLMHSVYGNMAEIARSISVKAYYRPRRSTL